MQSVTISCWFTARKISGIHFLLLSIFYRLISKCHLSPGDERPIGSLSKKRGQLFLVLSFWLKDLGYLPTACRTNPSSSAWCLRCPWSALVFKAVCDQPSYSHSCLLQPPATCACSPPHMLTQLHASPLPSTHLECALAPSPNTRACWLYPEIGHTLLHPLYRALSKVLDTNRTRDAVHDSEGFTIRSGWMRVKIHAFWLIQVLWLQGTRTRSKHLKRKEELIGRTGGFSEHQGKQPSWGSWELGIRELSLPLQAARPCAASFSPASWASCLCKLIFLLPHAGTGRSSALWSQLRDHHQ